MTQCWGIGPSQVLPSPPVMRSLSRPSATLGGRASPQHGGAVQHQMAHHHPVRPCLRRCPFCKKRLLPLAALLLLLLLMCRGWLCSPCCARGGVLGQGFGKAAPPLGGGGAAVRHEAWLCPCRCCLGPSGWLAESGAVQRDSTAYPAPVITNHPAVIVHRNGASCRPCALLNLFRIEAIEEIQYHRLFPR
jgi:hypothetical protein